VDKMPAARAATKDGFCGIHRNGALGIARPVIDLQHVFHISHKGRAGVEITDFFATEFLP
jgi:hypothetical protein